MLFVVVVDDLIRSLNEYQFFFTDRNAMTTTIRGNRTEGEGESESGETEQMLMLMMAASKREKRLLFNFEKVVHLFD